MSILKSFVTNISLRTFHVILSNLHRDISHGLQRETSSFQRKIRLCQSKPAREINNQAYIVIDFRYPQSLLFIFFLLAHQLPVGRGLLIHEVSRSHTKTHHSR